MVVGIFLLVGENSNQGRMPLQEFSPATCNAVVRVLSNNMYRVTLTINKQK